MILLSARLQLREFCPRDLDALVAYATPREMRRYERGLPDREAAQSFLDRVIRRAEETQRTHYFLAISVLPTDQIVGHITLTSQNPEFELLVRYALQTLAPAAHLPRMQVPGSTGISRLDKF